MAVDELLLASAVDEGRAVLRLYQWSEPTLSLGYFQSHEDRQQHAASRDCAIVRRQSGGGAILHEHELTYSLVLPAGSPFARNVENLYTTVHQAIIAAVSEQVALPSQWALRLRETVPRQPSSSEPFLCFQRRARGDIVLSSPQEVWKILGSAQRRYRGAILQHGSLLIKRSQAAPELLGVADLTGTCLNLDQLSITFSALLEDALHFELTPSSLPENLNQAVKVLEQSKYKSSAWTHRR